MTRHYVAIAGTHVARSTFIRITGAIMKSSYVELTCHVDNRAAFLPLGLREIFRTATAVVLAGELDSATLLVTMRPVRVPFRAFRAGDEAADPLMLVSDGADFVAIPTRTWDARPYAVLDQNGLPSSEDREAAQRFYRIEDNLLSLFGE